MRRRISLEIKVFRICAIFRRRPRIIHLKNKKVLVHNWYLVELRKFCFRWIFFVISFFSTEQKKYDICKEKKKFNLQLGQRFLCMNIFNPIIYRTFCVLHKQNHEILRDHNNCHNSIQCRLQQQKNSIISFPPPPKKTKQRPCFLGNNLKNHYSAARLWLLCS